MGKQPDWLYKLKRVYNAFYVEDMEFFYQHGQKENAKPLTLTHLILLASVAGEKKATMNLAKRTMDQRWTVAELRSAIAKTKKASPSRPTSIPAGIHKMLKSLQSANKQVDDLVEHVFDGLVHLPPSDFTATIKSDLENIQEQLELFGQNAEMLSSRVAAALQRCDNVRAATEKKERENQLETTASA